MAGDEGCEEQQGEKKRKSNNKITWYAQPLKNKEHGGSGVEEFLSNAVASSYLLGFAFPVAFDLLLLFESEAKKKKDTNLHIHTPPLQPRIQ